MALLTTDGEVLKDAVRETLSRLLSAAGMSEAALIDVDKECRASGTAQRREDLRIEVGEYIILVNVAGRQQSFKPTSLNQLDRHQRLFFRERSMSPDRVSSLLIANHNYAGGRDPRTRGEIFGSGTAEARDRLVDAGHSAMTTFDLYRLFRATQANEIALTREAVLRMLRTEGIFVYATFIEGLQTPK